MMSVGKNPDVQTLSSLQNNPANLENSSKVLIHHAVTSGKHLIGKVFAFQHNNDKRVQSVLKNDGGHSKY